jgi:hypothetical protein
MAEFEWRKKLKHTMQKQKNFFIIAWESVLRCLFVETRADVGGVMFVVNGTLSFSILYTHMCRFDHCVLLYPQFDVLD